MESKRMGRPPKKPDDVKTARLEVRMTTAEFALVEAAADGKLATWAREALIRAARRVKGSGKRGN